MKSPCTLLLGACLAGHANAAGAELSPITRVVELLQGLAKQAQEDGKKEEDMYESYVCWAKAVIDTKTATNAEAQSRVDELEAYIADLDAGRIELTTERVDLEKEIKDRSQELEQMKVTREQEHEDYLQAKEDMLKGIEGLENAIAVMMKATGGDTAASTVSGGFLQTEAGETHGFAARVLDAQKLDLAVNIGKKYLGTGDAVFLESVLSGEMPKLDHTHVNNKKNRGKATYKSRSFHIGDVLTKVKLTMEQNLEDSIAADAKAWDDYRELKAAKEEELSTVQDALNKGDGENGARASSKADSQTEMDALNTQIQNDNNYMDTTAADLATKKSEWKDRKELRTGEIAAINKAIAILYSDDARDTFASSFKSQGFFLQMKSSSKSERVVDVLNSAAKMSGDKRLVKLAKALQPASMATGSHFDEVIASIDDMVATLKSEEETDRLAKEQCERDRDEDTRSALKNGRTMDERTDTITELKADIVAIEKTIAENEVEIKEIQAEIVKAQKLRADEHTEWEAATREDEAANQLVLQAKDVLARFYQDNNLVLVQKAKKKMEPVVAGEAPPPPPSTWEEPYGGKTGQATGIVATLEMISEDLVKDKTKAKSMEDKAQSTFNGFMEKSNQQIQALEDANSALTDTKGSKQDDISIAKEQRIAQKNQMEAVIQKINDATPLCSYNTINYLVRLKNRQVEIDGLQKAKAILQGGEFPSLLDRR